MIIKIPFKEYTEIDAVNSSKLKDFINIPLLYQKKHITKTLVEKEKEHFKFGRAVHCYILEPEKFYDQYVVVDIKGKKTDKFKEAEKQAIAESKEAFTSDEFELIKYYAEELKNKPNWNYLDNRGEVYYETTIVVTCPYTDFKLKAMLDKFIVIPPLKIIAIWDPKAIDASDYDDFASKAGKYGYIIQSVFYEYLLSLKFPDYDVLPLTNVILSKSELREIGFTKFREADRQLSKAVMHKGLEKLKIAQEKNIYEGNFHDRIQEIKLNDWDRKKMEKYLESE